MRFVLFDRILEFKKGDNVILLKNVTHSEDYFIDHFPGFPVVPGSIILGSFEQGGIILIAESFNFSILPVLSKVSKAQFRNFVLPGDQIRIILNLDSVSRKKIEASAEVRGKSVATARLEYDLEDPKDNTKVLGDCKRIKDLYELLNSNPLSKAWDLWGENTQC